MMLPHEAMPARLQQVYQQFSSSMLDELSGIYTRDIVFQDPVREVKGLAELRHYFSGMMDGLTECHFEFHETLVSESIPGDGQAVLIWTMHYRHPRLAGGKAQSLSGNSHVKYRERIYYHRDYYDMGAMIYEQVPVLRTLIAYIKRRLDS